MSVGLWTSSKLACVCGREITESEAGICAWCRMEHRGDARLLSHDSAGWGSSKCGCGTCDLTLETLRQPTIELDEQPVCAHCGEPAEFKVAGISLCTTHERQAA